MKNKDQKFLTKDLANNEISFSMYTITYMYREHHLTEYLKTLSDLELECAYRLIIANDIEGEAIGILDAIKNEQEYRRSSQILEESKGK